jgi:hypothetical protein
MIASRITASSFRSRSSAAGLIVDEQTRVCKQPCNFFVSDVSEVHAGAEYRWYHPKFTMAFRAGTFRIPTTRSGSEAAVTIWTTPRTGF